MVKKPVLLTATIPVANGPTDGSNPTHISTCKGRKRQLHHLGSSDTHVPRRRITPKHLDPLESVHSREEMLDWAPWLHKNIQLSCGTPTEHIALGWATMRLSTRFSGIGTPEYSRSWFHHHLQSCPEYNPDTMPAYCKGTHGIEKDISAQKVLLANDYCPEHLYGNIMDFIKPEKLSLFENKVTTASIAELKLMMLNPDHWLRSEAKCMCCQKMCPLDEEGDDVHVAGSPCTDVSPQGLRQGCRGPTFIPFVVWCLLVAKYKHKRVIHENVPEFDAKFWLVTLLGHIYDVHSVVLDSADYGFCVRRERRWSVLSHRGFLTAPTISLQDFVWLCRRHTHNSWHMVVGAGSEEFESELNWARNRPTSFYKCKSKSFAELSPEVQKLVEESPYAQALTVQEMLRLQDYIKYFRAKYPNITLDLMLAWLNQNFDKQPHLSVGSTANTFFSNSPVVFNVSPLKRWLFPSEHLLAQGFVAQQGLTAEGKSVPLFIRSPSRNQSVKQSGNAMNVYIVAMMMSWSLFSIKARPRMILDAFMEEMLRLSA